MNVSQDSKQLSRPEDVDTAPESPSAIDTHEDDYAGHTTQQHHHRNVNFDFFNPSGVNELRRSMSRMSSERTNRGLARSQHASLASGISDDTLIPEGDFDLEKFARGYMRKLDESGKRRELGVMFKDLRVVGVGATAVYQPTFGSMLNPLNVLQYINSLRHPALRDILSGFEGCIRPGEMLLVLGRPGAGCSTFLKALANQRDEYYAVEGEVTYDSLSAEQVRNHYRGDVQYCPEDDVHFPTLTVEETISFAAKTRTPRSRVLAETRSEHVERAVNILTTVFGLSHVRKTPVGDAAIRGVSGGQKKRVSICETLAALSKLNAWDNSTRGLDASTALEFAQALRLATDFVRQTTLVSLYQAGESLYELFDKVCVIYDGKMAYFGLADRARQYFIDMGYKPADRQTTADFLVAVTDPNGRTIREGYENRVPRTAQEFADYFKKSELGTLNREDMQSYCMEYVGKEHLVLQYKKSYRADHAHYTNPKSPYIISIPMQAKALMLRRLQILKGDYIVQVIQTATFIIQAVIMGTIFLRLHAETSAFFSRGGVLFFALLFASLSMMAEIPALFSQRHIVLRQSRAAMYHPFVDSLALTLVDVPKMFVIIVFFSVVLYFLVGLQQSAKPFFIFLLFVITMTLIMQAFFRMLAAAFRSPAPAQTIAGLSILILSLYTGYLIPQPSMIGALRWITHISPLKYGFESLMVNEFHGLIAECSSIIPQGPGYEGISSQNQACTAVGAIPGETIVNGERYLELSYSYVYSHLWRNLGIMWAFGIAFVATYLVFTEFNTKTAGETSTVLFKRGSKVDIDKHVSSDEEKNVPAVAASIDDSGANTKHTSKAAPAMSDVFSWHHLNYTIPLSSGGTRKLLDDVSGYVAPGKLTALVGASGAGKTTLLNTLAQRVSTGVVTGDRFVNGHPLPSDFQAQTGYVQQMDTHLPTSTVREALLFSAKLRQPASVPLAEKEAYVDECLKMCGLEAYADAVVGSLGVEHRKRTTIGVELAAKPRLLLFLDEPTSGLDSQSAWAIMSFLRTLADNGQAILCTIHQPSAELFEFFDRLLLLKPGGQTIYFGDLGDHCNTLIDYFQRNGARRCDPKENPAEYILAVTGAGATARSEIDWHDVWVKSTEAQDLQRELDGIHTEGRRRPPPQATYHSEFATSWSYQLINLIQREALDHWRSPSYLLAKLALNICAGLLVGFTFFKAKDTIQGTQNKLFAIFIALLPGVPLGQQLQVPFIGTRNIYEIRERPSRMYSWTAMVTAQMIVEMPWNIFGSSLFFLAWYWTVGFPTDRAGYTYLMYSVMTPIYYTTIGQAVAAMSPNAEIAALLFSFFFSFVLIFSGVLQPYQLLGWWKWMYRLSPYTYLVEGLLGQAVGRQEISCSPVELTLLIPPSGQTCSTFLQPFVNFAGGYLNNPEATSNCQFCAFRTADQLLLQGFNIQYSHHWRNFGIFVAFILFNIAATFAFTYFFRIAGWNVGPWIKTHIFRRK